MFGALCNGQVDEFLRICHEINFPVAPEKTVWATTIIVFLGILIDTAKQTISIPLEKRCKALNLLEEILNSRKTTIKKLQQVTGLLNFISRAIILGRAFTRRMYAKFSGEHMKEMKTHYHVKVDHELKADCMVWWEFLQSPESISRPFMDFVHTLIADEIDFFTDASEARNLGFGCIYGPNWAYNMWEPGFVSRCQLSIEFLELFGVAVAMELWSKLLQNRRVIIFCDNKSVVEIINKTVSSCAKCMILIRIMTLTSIKNNVRFFAKYVPSKENILADAFSRNKLEIFWKNVRSEIPEKLWPPSKF